MVAPTTTRHLEEVEDGVDIVSDVEDDVDSVSDVEDDVDERHREVQATDTSTCAKAIFNSKSTGVVEVSKILWTGQKGATLLVVIMTVQLGNHSCNDCVHD